MTEDADDRFHMLQTWIDGRKLVEVGRMMNLPLRRADNNYLCHCLLGKLFGDDAPKPFWLDEDPRRERASEMQLLGYAGKNADALRRLADTYAEPSLHEALDWDRTASKTMPGEFPQRMQLGFELRACPVVRKGSSGPKWNAGQEVDAFLSKVWEVDDESVNIEREQVYSDWLVRQFEIRGGADPDADSIELKRFSIEQMLRRRQGGDREPNFIKRPDVTLTGELRVADGEQFRELLRSGIGRHKSFGFGMLKVRPA